ncbi:MAG: hypothetical protein FD163_2377 [Hyphomonadaceae bacterium]|nr:MAG: Uncharacterized protein FD128_910 [Hyphomonadaceae bacterium]KAF0183260.1 MAG: hypothetical protein FD163_2377 [Hyphomonadaceae bacterium]
MVLAKKARLKIGITAHAGIKPINTLWSNGIGQNIGYLALLLRRLQIVDSVNIVSCPDGETHTLGTMFGLPVVSMDTAAATLDIIIELGIRGAQPHHIDTLRNRGGKIINYVAGNTLVINLEALARDTGNGDWINPKGYDAVWITPQNWHTNHGYFKLTYSPKTSIAPHIWDPVCLNQAAFDFKHSPFYKTPKEKAWALGCFEPNINVYKTFHLSLLTAENAYRQRPDLVGRLLLFGAYKLRETAHLTELFASLKLGQDKKVFVENRLLLAEIMGRDINAVVSHQWQNNLNYLYWEVLYLGWPLIHNSIQFSDVGYYYPEFDPKKGGEIMVDGLENHNEYRVKQADAIRETLFRYSIENPKVQARYTELIEEAMS